jgi:hypothetical protein
MTFYLDHFGVDILMEVHYVVYQLLWVYMFDLYYEKQIWELCPIVSLFV